MVGGAFQGNGFQLNAFQIYGAGTGVGLQGAVPNVKIVLDHHLFRKDTVELRTPNTRGPLPTVEQQLHSMRQKRKELEELELKTAQAEKQQALQIAQKASALLDLSNQAGIEEAGRLEAQAQENIRSLYEEKTRLMRLIQDEEETMVVLYSLPFMH